MEIPLAAALPGRGSRGGRGSACHGMLWPLGGRIKQALQARRLRPSHLTFLLVPTCPASGPQPRPLTPPPPKEPEPQPGQED